MLQVFPFDLPPGPTFMFVYLAIAMVGFTALWIVTRVVGNALDRQAVPRTPPTHMGGYRTQTPKTASIGIGRLPHGNKH